MFHVFLSGLKSRIRLVILNPIKHCCSFIKHYLLRKKNKTDMGIQKDLKSHKVISCIIFSLPFVPKRWTLKLWTYFLFSFQMLLCFICCYVDILSSKC